MTLSYTLFFLAEDGLGETLRRMRAGDPRAFRTWQTAQRLVAVAEATP